MRCADNPFQAGKKGPWRKSPKTTVKNFEALANQYASKIAISDDWGSATFADLRDFSLAWALWLESAGRDRQLRVMNMLPGGVCFTALQLGCLQAGSTFIPVSDSCTPEELRRYLTVARPDVIVAAKETEALEQVRRELPVILVPELLNGSPEAWRLIITNLPKPEFTGPAFPEWGLAAQIQFTSGSTGAPKGILVTEANLQANLDNNAKWLNQFAGSDLFSPMPQFHAMGGALVLEFLSCGCGVHLCNDGLFADHLRRINQHHVSVIGGPPSYFRMMTKIGALTEWTVPSVSSLILGSDACDQVLYANLRERLPQATVSLRYGLSESVGTMARHDLLPGDLYPVPGIVGKAVPNLELRFAEPVELGEPGEILVRGGTVASRILEGGTGNLLDLVDAEGYLHTGDLGGLSDDGHLVISGRNSQFIKRNGYRISPQTIEDVLRLHPSVQDAVVVGQPDPLAGEWIGALVEVSCGADDALLLENLRSSLGERVAAYQIPQEIRSISRLPRTATSKPDRHYIKLHFSEFTLIK